MGCPIERYDLALDLTGLDGVVDYEPDDFTITIGAGMPLADLQQTLAANGQFVPLDHGRFEQATVGGVIAVGRGGLRRTAFGYPRDWLIGMHMVRADGTPIKGGGRVVKNVSGYDLPKLFCGSLGTLGVIVELTFKLRPLPTSDQIVVLAAVDFPTALVAARAAGQAEPSLQAAVAVSAASVNALASVELDVAPGAAAVVLRMSGLEQSVLETLDSAARAARNAGATGGRPSPDGVIEIWQAILDLELATADDQLRLRLGVRPASLGRCAARTRPPCPRRRALDRRGRLRPSVRQRSVRRCGRRGAKSSSGSRRARTACGQPYDRQGSTRTEASDRHLGAGRAGRAADASRQGRVRPTTHPQPGTLR